LVPVNVCEFKFGTIYTTKSDIPEVLVIAVMYQTFCDFTFSHLRNPHN